MTKLSNYYINVYVHTTPLFMLRCPDDVGVLVLCDPITTRSLVYVLDLF